MAVNLLEPDPFNKASLAPVGDAAVVPIYAAVGYALHRWEGCETSIATVYSSLVKPKGGNHVLMRSFGTITAPSTRQEMIKYASEAYFEQHENPALLAELKAFLKLYQNAGQRRNDIAHAVVEAEGAYAIIDNKAVPLPDEWFLVPSIFTTKKRETRMRGPKYRFSSREIRHYADCFEALGEKAGKLSTAIRKFYSSFPEKYQSDWS
ncbi:MAG: hypothetical protein JWR51_2013 [Devosia sp.]|uniref:hypothetical protein n=1 Tax=Devosia sp. TaxID=1871048 RepID=UPI00261E54FE|nr:hypothetical protein [Devosia sp.]MDB5528910.1 hypothetical protein [Devosia sp.]